MARPKCIVVAVMEMGDGEGVQADNRRRIIKL